MLDFVVEVGEGVVEHEHVFFYVAETCGDVFFDLVGCFFHDILWY